MTSEESEDLENILSQLNNQVDETSGSMLKLVYFSHFQEGLKMEIENLMDQKEDKIEKLMDQRIDSMNQNMDKMM